ncbi:S1C family serine protease [Tahibacter amnicola]|uniref:Trypsin-like peptidase domain-containing protein n=1 Tax=Tahibacter amnicola TaxID=2976241 RepID=A0ABY6BHZ0_9GAMM|nr:trypsin-like peptidase domain-containing protein [Tahibacter amnicola]UXI69494.1 trypsin-like peptidase domain-containing protein [Tahibacter amnicola]
MKSALRTLAFLLQSVTVGLAAAFVITRLWPATPAPAPTPANIPPATATPAPAASFPSPAGVGPVSYADAVAKAAPAVVNIYATKFVASTARLVQRDPLMQRLLGGYSIVPTQRRERSLGSGVIVSANGYVMTNNHVIAQAHNIEVLLHDGRFATAQLVGGDDDTDLAVLKIDLTDLPTVDLTHGAPPVVGDVVLAIGNAAGIGKTVTMGVVSAVGRHLEQWASEEFIQTDAAINVGNSGGALINAHGDLIGINTAASNARRTGTEGIGFAIPTATAKQVFDQLVAHGVVVRGWLGAEYEPVIVASGGEVSSAQRGAKIVAIYPNSPAADAGLQPEDVITKLDMAEIADPLDLRKREGAIAPGTTVHITGLRAGIPFETDATLKQRPVVNQPMIPMS